ncbi:13317_t:CDS:2, partial [Racocetra persica]
KSQKSLEYKLKSLNDITNNYTSRQIQFNNEQKNFIEIYSTSNKESKNSNLDLSIYSLSNSSNGIIITDNKELVSDINKNNSINKDNINYMNENSDNYELDSSFRISNESKLLNNTFIDFMNVVDKYNISNKKQTEQQLPFASKLLSIILYSDGINLTSDQIIYPTVPDRLHHLDIGLFYYQIKYSRMLLKKLDGNDAINKINYQFRNISPIHGLKIFKFRLQNIKYFIAGKYQDIIKVIPFIIDSILNSFDKQIDKALMILFIKWNIMYKMSCNTNPNENDLKEFEASVK